MEYISIRGILKGCYESIIDNLVLFQYLKHQEPTLTLAMIWERTKYDSRVQQSLITTFTVSLECCSAVFPSFVLILFFTNTYRHDQTIVKGM